MTIREFIYRNEVEMIVEEYLWEKVRDFMDAMEIGYKTGWFHKLPGIGGVRTFTIYSAGSITPVKELVFRQISKLRAEYV